MIYHKSIQERFVSDSWQFAFYSEDRHAFSQYAKKNFIVSCCYFIVSQIVYPKSTPTCCPGEIIVPSALILSLYLSYTIYNSITKV